jgi:hypothetical protein
VIRDGRIVDGTGPSWYAGDVAAFEKPNQRSEGIRFRAGARG